MSRDRLRFWIEASVLLSSCLLIGILIWMLILRESSLEIFVRFLQDPTETILYEHSGGGDWVRPRFNLGIEDWLYCRTHSTTCCTLAYARFCKI